MQDWYFQESLNFLLFWNILSYPKVLLVALLS
jgi:hypothetical protein